jgi:hypothetical protein
MLCRHECFQCVTRSEPKPHESLLVGNRLYYSAVPACHPNADNAAFVLGSPPSDEKVEVAIRTSEKIFG